MSEYQYYEFQAIDKPLDAAARTALRAISSRAQITATSFSNEYNYGDLKADPQKMLERYFDLLCYSGFWQVRRFAMRVPKRLIDRAAIDRFGIDHYTLEIVEAGDHLIIDVSLTEMDLDPDDETGWLAALAPLRAAVMRGDLRLFYMLWLMQLGFADAIDDDVPEPLPGLAPLDGPLTAWAEFLDIDPDLVAAAAEHGTQQAEPDDAAVDAFLRSLSDAEKHAILRSVYDGDNPHLATELRRRCQGAGGAAEPGSPSRRTAGELRAAAQRIADAEAERERQRVAAEQQRRAEAEAKAKAERLARLAGREAEAWRKVELLVEQKNRKGYEEALDLLEDLRELMPGPAFSTRLDMLRIRHGSKRSFITRLDAAGLTVA